MELLQCDIFDTRNLVAFLVPRSTMPVSHMFPFETSQHSLPEDILGKGGEELESASADNILVQSPNEG